MLANASSKLLLLAQALKEEQSIIISIAVFNHSPVQEISDFKEARHSLSRSQKPILNPMIAHDDSHLHNI
jgi:hypothetical protein